MSIGIYRGDALQFVGKSGGKNFRPLPKKKFTVSKKRVVTVKITSKTRYKIMQ
jgi:hypothetical protein